MPEQDARDPDTASRETARHLWGRLEAVHTLHYFAPTVRDALAGIGLDDRHVSYVASRSAPCGPVGPELVTAMFYGFSPRYVARALPAAWQVASPPTVLATSLAALRTVLHDALDGMDAEVARAAELLREAALLHPTLGRPLAAAWSSVAWHEDAFVRLWHGATVIRESRGDGHVACLLGAQLDGIESHLIGRGDGPKLRSILGPMRGHTDPEWDAAVSRLVARGLMELDGSLTAAGEQLRDQIETRTDELAAPPWEALGAPATSRLVETLEPLVQRLVATGILPGIVVRAATR